MTLKGSDETKHAGRDGINRFTRFAPLPPIVRCNFSATIYVFLLFTDDCPLSSPLDILKNLALSLLFLRRSFSTFSTLRESVFPQQYEYERNSNGGRLWPWKEEENPRRVFVSRRGALFNKTGQRNIDDSIWFGFFRARVSTANRKEPGRH